MAKLFLPVLLALTLMMITVKTSAEERDIEQQLDGLVENKNEDVEIIFKQEKRELKKRSNKKRQKHREGRKGKIAQKNRGRNRKSKSRKNETKNSKYQRKRSFKEKLRNLKKGRKDQKGHTKKSKNRVASKRKRKYSCRQVTKFCPLEKATSLKLLYNQVYNFKKQLKRAQNQAKIVQKKKAKNTIFMKDALILTDIVGGNLSAPICTATARSAAAASSAGATLAGCSSSISTSCEDIPINTTLTSSCSATMSAFETKIAQCRSAGCECWAEAVAMRPDITKCNALKESEKVKTKKKTCLTIFSGCKKAQDSAVEYTATCPAPVESASTTPEPSITSNKSSTTTTTNSPISDTTESANMTLETPVNMTFETPVNMTFETPVSMTFETPVNMTLGTPVNMTLEVAVNMSNQSTVTMVQTATTKGSSRKERCVKNYMAKAMRNYMKRS